MPARRGVLALLVVAASAWAADPPGSPQANEALALCERAGKAQSPAEKRKLFDEGLARAEEAVKADERDAKAHFAVFCNLGRELRLRGVGLGTVGAVRRLRREIDRTLELAPDYADALVGKGSFLVELPRLLGGDPAEGERALRAALRIDPDFIEAHLALARALAARGARDEARREARQALGLAERAGDQAAAAEARKLVESLAP